MSTKKINENLIFTIQHPSTLEPYVGQKFDYFPPQFDNLYLINGGNIKSEKELQMQFTSNIQLITYNQNAFDGIIAVWRVNRPDLPFTVESKTADTLVIKIKNDLTFTVESNGVFKINGKVNNDLYRHLIQTMFAIVYSNNKVRDRFVISNDFKPRN